MGHLLDFGGDYKSFALIFKETMQSPEDNLKYRRKTLLWKDILNFPRVTLD